MQISLYLRTTETGHLHWCPACDWAHGIPYTWKFDGNVDSPTFDPSVKIQWWDRKLQGIRNYECCHYNLIAGKLIFHEDCTHAMRNSTVPLPLLPKHLLDNPS
jgi:hypothetical protein